MTMVKQIRFGIPTLDNLFLGNEKRDLAPGGVVLPEVDGKTERTSMCIVGPDGSGKSLFALHLASRYAADVAVSMSGLQPPSPHVIFVSTDFSYARAQSAWDNFDLDHPFGRKIPFESLLEPYQRRKERSHSHRCSMVRLAQHFPLGSQDPVAEIFREANSCAWRGKVNPAEYFETSVKFLDVANSSSGDDWAFVCRLLALLPPIENDQPSHMLIIDAVEGFETLVGEIDQFGERQSRRARIAQIVRLAAPKCHIVFIAEEPEAQPSIPEQFVADVVIRLRCEKKQGTARHTLEIEKARGQRHALGPQPYFIRDGSGSSTGSERNLDDPRIFHGKRKNGEGQYDETLYHPGYDNILNCGFDTQDLEGHFQGYIHVTHSIQQRSREIIELDRETGFRPTSRVSTFGIPHLDSLLPRQDGESHGLPQNKLSAMIGEAGTHKSHLSLAWIAEAFRSYCDSLLKLKDALQTEGAIKATEAPLLCMEQLQEVLPAWGKWTREGGAPSQEMVENLHAKARDEENGVKYEDLDPAFAFQYRKRKIDRDIERLIGATSPECRALEAATLLLRYRYGLSCEPMPTIDDGVAVLLSTRDDTANSVSEWICNRLISSSNHHLTGEARSRFVGLLKGHVRRRLIVRRLEIHNATPESVFHIIESLVHAGRRALLGDGPYQKKHADGHSDRKQRHKDDEGYFRASGAIRFVIDDFSSFRDSYPDLRSDSVFLPFLVFWLGRMGATGLIVCTSDGQPTREVTDPVEVQIRALVAQRIQTWRVAFHGTQRVAITGIPSPQSNRPSPVREVVRKADDLVDASREFELYANVGQSKPERVPLEIRLFSHTDAAKAFVAEENKVFRSVFGTQSPSDIAPTEPGAILWGAKTEDYDVLRDFCHLQGGSRLDRTIILQVDEFWLSRTSHQSSGDVSALRDLSAYRNDRRFEDHYGVFLTDASEPKSRIDHFSSINSEGNEGEVAPHQQDRIPFTWDFGFLLCDWRAWREMLEEPLPTFPVYKFPSPGEVSIVPEEDAARRARAKQVKWVWDRLPGGGSALSRQKRFEGGGFHEQAGWYEFLMAASAVARQRALRLNRPVGAFEFSRMSKGTVTCVLLEIWASEIYRGLGADSRGSFLGNLGKKSKFNEDLIKWVDEYRFELFRAIILLTEVLAADDIRDSGDAFEIRVGPPLKESVAVRHWYSTACNHSDSVDLAPVGLPGHFSVRGDWFLAVADGSRSDLLADRALDLLSSKRSNHTRMQLGIGLATRRLGSPARNRTKLSWYGPHEAYSNERTRRLMTHSEIAGLGANDLKGDQAFGWLWRSALDRFDRQSRVIRKWLASVLQRWYEHESYLDHEWVRGFELYDFLGQLRVANKQLDREEFEKMLRGPIWNGRLSPGGRLSTWADFDSGCEDLKASLRIAASGVL